jgi:hypothetical protein
MEPRILPSRLRPLARSSIQWWFEALDNRRIGAARQSRIALVTGIHPDASDLWIQVMPAGDPARQIVLHVSQHTNLYDAVAALEEAWSEGPSERSVIHLAPAA